MSFVKPAGSPHLIYAPDGDGLVLDHSIVLLRTELVFREGGQPSQSVRFAAASMEASIAMPTVTPEPMPLELTETPKATALESTEAMAFEFSQASKAA